MGIFSRKKDTPERPPADDTATQPTLVKNERVAAALSKWGAAKNAQTMAEVLRHCVTGELLLDATGSQVADPAHPFQPGDTLAVGTQTDNAGKNLLLAFTSNETLTTFHRGKPVLSLAQPAAAALTDAASRYDGVAIDAGGDNTLIAYSEEIRANLTDDPAANAALRSAVIERTLSWASLLDLLETAPMVFIAMTETLDEDGNVIGVNVPTARGPNDERLHPVFTSPAEVFAWAPGHIAQQTTTLKFALAADRGSYDGMLINPAGPSLDVPIEHVRELAQRR